MVESATAFHYSLFFIFIGAKRKSPKGTFRSDIQHQKNNLALKKYSQTGLTTGFFCQIVLGWKKRTQNKGFPYIFV